MSAAGFEWEQNSYFQLLDVSPQATADDIRKAYRQKALETHPDRFPLNSEAREAAEARFVLLTQARDTLLNPELRAAYEAEQELLQQVHLDALKQQYDIPFQPPRKNSFQDALKKAYAQAPEAPSHFDVKMGVEDVGDEASGDTPPGGTPQASKENAATFYYTQGLRYAARGSYRRAFYALSNAKMLNPDIDIPPHIMNKVRLYAYYTRR